ncbi:unnamed protein product [Ilex paraguariensis]|uniref:PB1 domain-containing protein n=1 Tax=Ilex paraguariensis TaxID=185542 RepID=A0ABC8RQY7_9AQUA
MSTEAGIVVEPIRWGSGRSLPGSAPGSAPGSPRNRVKFLCSHGGKILPRPADGHLKYAGGETRVISVPRDIKFPELMKKLTYLIEGEMVLKYQLIPEDLDALISVKSDEDLRHMLDECDRYESTGTPRLRAFLFPANSVVIENLTGSLEQRYVDAINGILRPSALSGMKHLSINANLAPYNFPSTCSSPISPESCTTEAMHPETVLLNGYQNGRIHMQRVHSSPSLCSLNGQHHSNQHIQQQHNHYYPNYRQSQPHGCHLSKPPIDSHKGGGPERFMTVRSVGRADSARYQVDHPPHVYYSSTRPSKGSGCCNKCSQFDECGPSCTERRFDRTGSFSLSPSFPLSPHYGHVGVRAWDSAMPGDS